MSDALTRFALSAGGFGLTWLAQSTALLILGLLAGRAARRRGPALQSAVYRTTLAAVLICPFASAVLSMLGVEGLVIRLPQAAGDAPRPITDEAIVKASLASGSVTVGLGKFEVTAPPSANAPTFDDVKFEITPIGPPVGFPLNNPLAAGLPYQPPLPPNQVTVEKATSRYPAAMAAGAGVALWAFGTLFFLARMLAQQARMARVRVKAVEVEPGVQAASDAIAGRLGVRPPPVRRSPFLSGPCLDGLIRPMILLPEEMDDDPRDALVHELAHLARRDGWWNLARRSATAGLWFQPLLWILSRRVEATAEEVCDDVAVDLGADRTRYAELLVTIADRSLPPSSPAAVCMIGRRSPLRRRVARILDASRPLSTRAGRLAILAVLAAGLASTALAGLLTVGRGPRPEPPAMAEEPSAPRADAAHGRVVDPDGKPVAGATVVARRFRQSGSELLPVGRDVARVATDAEGRFHLPDDAVARGDEVSIVVKAAGFRPAVVRPDSLSAGVPVTMPRGDASAIEGRVVDGQGRAIAGARVHVSRAYLSTPSAPAPQTLADLARSTPISGWAVQDEPATTDAEGRFRIDGLASDDAALLEISAPGIARKATTVVSRPMPTVPPTPGVILSPGFNDGALHGSPSDIPVEPSRPIEGTVRDVETNEPIPGAIVTARSISDQKSLMDGLVWTQTDAQGRYRLDGLPKEGDKGHRLAVYPPLDRPYFINRDFVVPPSPGETIVPFDMTLRRGIWIEGRVTDLETGAPASALVDYYPMLSNPHAKDYPNFRSGIMTLPWQRRYWTDADGRYRVPGLPGAGVVAVRAQGKTDYRTRAGAEEIEATPDGKNLLTYERSLPYLYHSLKRVDAPEDAKSFACDLGLDPGRTVVLRVVDEAGAAATGAEVVGASPNTVDHNHVVVDAKGEARVRGLIRGDRRTVQVLHPTRRLGAIHSLNVGAVPEDAPVVVTLRPFGTVSGHLVDGQGRPARGHVRIVYPTPAAPMPPFSVTIESEEVDADGRFRLDGVPSGGAYTVTASQNGPPPAQGRPAFSFKPFELATGLKVEAGRDVDLGTFNVDEGRRIEEPKPAPPPAPAPAGPIRGRVTDEDGKPVAGATVVAWRWHRGEALGVGLREFIPDRRFDYHAATADAEGRYSMPDFDPVPDGDDQARFVMLRAAAPGYAVGSAVWRNPNPGAKLGGDVKLAKGDQPITGRLIDAQGQPVVGARVKLRVAYLPIPGHALGDGPSWHAGRGSAPGAPIQQALGLADLTTDADGRFRIPGLARETVAILEFVRPDLAPTLVRVLARLGEPQKTRDVDPESDLNQLRDFVDVQRMASGGEMVSSWSSGVSATPTYGSDFTTTLEPARIVEGTVRGAETREPIAGIAVAVLRDRSSGQGRPARFWTRTDAQGRYRMAVPPTYIAMGAVSVHPRADQPYFIAGITKTAKTPDAPATWDFTLRRGRWIVGKLTDADDGRPVAASIDYAPMAANPLAAECVGPSQGFMNLQNGYHGDRFRTAPDGTFRVLGIPGPGVVMARADDPSFLPGQGAEGIARDPRYPNSLATYVRINPNGYHALKALDVPPGDAPATCDLAVGHGGSVLLKFVDEKGEPLEATVTGRLPSPLPGAGFRSPRDEPKTEVRVTGLAPGQPRPVGISSAAGPSGVIAEVQAGPDRVMTLYRLVPVVGRLVHADGKPARGDVNMDVRVGDKPTPSFISPRSTSGLTDEQGRFRCLAAVGGPYQLQAFNVTSEGLNSRSFSASSQKVPGGFNGFFLTKDLRVEPDRPVDLGTFNVDTGRRIEDTKPVPPAPAAPAAGPINGRILDELGRPIAGASVVAWRWHRGEAPGVGLREFIPDRRFDYHAATADAEGRYSMPDFDPAPDGDDQARFVMLRAAAPGYAVGEGLWRSRLGQSKVGVDVKLARGDRPISGRVLDAQGRPVSGARVRLRLMRLTQVENPVAASRPPGLPPGNGAVGGPIQKALGLDGLITDADGRFRFPGLAPDAETIFEIEAPGRAPHLIRVFARPMASVTSTFSTVEGDLEAIRDFATEGGVFSYGSRGGAAGRPEQLVHGSEFTTTLEPSRVVEGVVRDSETHRPIAGVVLAASRARSDGRAVLARITSTTDAEGRYRLVSPPAFDGEAPWISVHPRADQPYFLPVASTRPRNTPGTPATQDFELKRGRWISGRLVDPVDGRPVAGSVDYAPMASNPLAAGYFGRSLADEIKFQQGYHDQRFRTAADGTFRVLGIAGPGVVLARADAPAYLTAAGAEDVAREPQSSNVLATSFRTIPSHFHVVKPIDVPEGDAPFPCDLAVDPGGSALLKFVDQEGQPVGAIISGWDPRVSVHGGPPPYTGKVPATEARILALAEGEARPVWIQAGSGNSTLAAAVTATAGSDRAVTLHPMVRLVGRILLADGKPSRGDVELYPARNGKSMGAGVPQTRSQLDAEGRFEFRLPVGGPYLLRAVNLTHEGHNGSRGTSPKKAPGGFDAFHPTKDLTIEPDKPVDLGTFNADTGQPADQAE